MTKTLLVVAAVAVLTTTTFAKKVGVNVRTDVVPKAEEFVQETIVSDIFEIQAGKLAQSKARKAGVKEFGATLVDGHTAIDRQLKSLLNSRRVKARAPDALDSSHASMLAQLQASDSDRFDGQFLSDVITDNKNNISLYKRYARDGDNAELKRFATMYLPTLQYDLNMAQSMSGEY